MSKEKKALVLFSGGVDSTTCLAQAIDLYGAKQVLALSVSYGQKHEKELEAARAIADYYQVDLQQMDLKSIFEASNCSLLEQSKEAIPHESYDVQLKQTEALEPVSTYVPFRNGLFLSVAASIGYSYGCACIYYGAHMDDAAGSAYPDCSEVFWNAMNTAIYEGSGKKIMVKAPFIHYTKTQIVAEGVKLNVPYQLTWSCYEGKEKPCGVCGTCIDRQIAFEANGLVFD